MTVLVIPGRTCRAATMFGLVLILLFGASCTGPSVEVGQALVVTNVTSGWVAIGFDEFGRNKLVPTISFQLENVSEGVVGVIQLNSVFRRCLVAYGEQPPPVSDVSPADLATGSCHGETQEWGNAFVRAVGRDGLKPGAAAGPFTLQSGLGYTGEQARLDMLQHRDFVDAKVEIFIKHRAEQWVKLEEHPIDRQLLTQ